MDRRTALQALAFLPLALGPLRAAAATDPIERRVLRVGEVSAKFKRIFYHGLYADEPVWKQAPALQERLAWDPYEGVADFSVLIRPSGAKVYDEYTARYWYTSRYCIGAPLPDDGSFELPLDIGESEDLLDEDGYAFDDERNIRIWRTEDPWDDLKQPFGYFSSATRMLPDEVDFFGEVDGIIRLRLTANCRTRE